MNNNNIVVTVVCYYRVSHRCFLTSTKFVCSGDVCVGDTDGGGVDSKRTIQTVATTTVDARRLARVDVLRGADCTQLCVLLRGRQVLRTVARRYDGRLFRFAARLFSRRFPRSILDD